LWVKRKDEIREEYSSLSLVDLAGSERINHDEDNVKVEETQHINKSLFALSNVI
jgi:hypothetical protein